MLKIIAVIMLFTIGIAAYVQHMHLQGKLVDDAHKFFKFWSVKLQLAAIAVTTYATIATDQLNQLWQTMPDDVKALIPAKYLPLISAGLMVASLMARITKQAKLNQDKPQ